ncbi:Small GTPase superfamily [Trinorchestia longiramus]|nr:Small GTPase superfamily [Trinorchestia longiramus]
MLEPERNGNSLKNNSSDKQSHLTNEKDSTIIVTSNVKLSNQQEIHSGPANSLFNASSKPNTNFILDSNDCDENCKPSSVQNKGTCAAKCYRLSTGPDPSSGAIPKLNSNLQVSDRGTSCRPKEHKRTLDKSWSELEDPFEYTEGQERRASISDPFFFKDCVKDLDKSFDLHADEYYAGKDYVSNLASKLRDGDIRQNDNSVSTFGNQKRNIYDSRRFPRQNDVSKNAFFGLGKLAPTRSPIHQPGKFTRESRVGNITDAREYYSAKKDFGNNIDMVSSGCDAQDETSRPNPRLKVNEVNDESFRLQELERRTKLFFEKIRMNRDAASQFLDVSPTLMTSDILSSPSPSSDSLNLYDFNEVQSEFDAQFKSKMLDFVNSTNSMLRQTRYLNISLTPEPLVMLPENWPSFSSSEPHNSTKLVPPETSKLFCETNSEFPTSQTTTVISSPVPSTETTDSFEQNIVPETRTPIKRVPLLSDTVPHFKYSVESPETDVNLPSSINSRKTVPNQKSEDTKLLQSYVTTQESLVAFNDSVNPTSSKVDKPVTTVAESFTNAQETENRSLLECPTEFVAPNIEDSNLLKLNPEPRKRRASIVTCDSVLADEHPSPDPVKIIVLGDDGVGKTALIVRLVTGRFIGDYDPTLSAVYSYNLPLEGYDEQLQLMDTGGQVNCEWIVAKKFQE